MASSVTASDSVVQECIRTIRMLAVDAVEAAQSGHPGAPMGCAEIAFALFTEMMRHDPRDPNWIDRDRFILSNGHASMLLYSMLHLCGYDVSLDEIRRFRQWGSKTPGHPERHDTPGVEMTTGPLGQGFAHGVGMAVAAKMCGARFTTDDFAPISHRIYAIVSDGDLMEGVASEAASLAGTLGLGNLVYIYDDNRITIDGSTDLAFTEDVEKRFEAYGWHTLRVDGHDVEAVANAIRTAADETERPSLVIARTHIGHGSPGKQDTAEAHGAPLGAEEVAATKAAIGWPEEPTFLVPDTVRAHFEDRMTSVRATHDDWAGRFESWREKHPELRASLDSFVEGSLPIDLEVQLLDFVEANAKDKEATRASCGAILQRAAELVPNLVGGSADLAGSNKTMIKDGGPIGPGSGHEGLAAFAGRSIHYGVREHAMAAIVNGMALHGTMRGIAATFLIFSDYMRPSIRLAALMNLPSIYVFSHDSFYLGEDGPTHQPIEQLASLRAIPNVDVWRPADSVEMAVAWAVAIRSDGGPCCLVTTRQGLPKLARRDDFTADAVKHGAYAICEPSDFSAGSDDADLVFVATGSEVSLAIDSAKRLTEEDGRRVRVVSMPSVDRFLALDESERESIVPRGVACVAIEAAATYGWREVVGDGALVIGLDRFGASAPAGVLAEKFGFTPDAVVTRVREWLA